MEGKCTHYGQDESSLHLFFHCPFAIEVWDAAPFKVLLQPNRISSVKMGVEASKLLVNLPPIGIGTEPLLPWILWTLWTCRNKKIFDQKQISAKEVISQAIGQTREWKHAQITPSPQRSAPMHIRYLRRELIRYAASLMRRGEKNRKRQVYDGSSSIT